MDRKGKGILAYLLGWLGGLIVLYEFKDNNRKDVFHACQAITLSVSEIVLSIAVGFVGGIIAFATGISFGLLSYVVYILYVVLLILGIVKVCNDEPDPKLPVIGDLTEKIFAKQINAAPETAANPATPRFDPNTGQPITQPQANFDPNTGQPITQPTTEAPVTEEVAPVAEEAPTIDAPTDPAA